MKKYLKMFDNEINKILNEVRDVNTSPAFDNILRIFKYDREIKVIIIGQDPYPNKEFANGLAFSVNRDVVKLPQSLKNIFKEIKINYPNSIFETGDLSYWSDQGVLLINSILSTEVGKSLSHKNLGWQKITDYIISDLSKEGKKVFILWGGIAQKKENIISKKDNLILKSSHPSPLSARVSFFGSMHFKKANDFLLKNNMKEINWSTK